MNNVTPEQVIGRGRPRKFASPAAKQKAYRDRKNQSAGFQPGTPVSHRIHGEGIITHVYDQTAHVAFIERMERTWRDLLIDDLTIIGKRRKVPQWSNPNVRLCWSFRQGKEFQLLPYSSELGCMPVTDRRDIPTYYKRSSKSGARRKLRDWSQAINRNLVSMMEDAYKSRLK